MTEGAVLPPVALLSILGALWSRGRRTHVRADDDSRTVDALRDRIGRLEREMARMEEILDRMEEGVIFFSDVLVPVVANRSARRLLGVGGDTLPPRLSSDAILSVARTALVDNTTSQEVVSIWPGRTRLKVRAAPLDDQGGVIVVLQDVTDELRTEQIRRQFVANASHELKSPVASLQALAEAIRQAVTDDPRAVERFATRLLAEAERLGRLIADLLDLSRVDDPANISNTWIDLSTVVRQMLEEAQSSARSKGLEVADHISSNVWVRGDRQQLALLVRNLVDNAIRYTPEGGSISVDLFREGGEVVLRVADDGIGIPLQAQRRIFERFYRVDKDRSRERGGTGLGLSIVKHVVELHGGHISVLSELGEGSTFTARLPAPTVASNGTRWPAPANPEGKD